MEKFSNALLLIQQNLYRFTLTSMNRKINSVLMNELFIHKLFVIVAIFLIYVTFIALEHLLKYSRVQIKICIIVQNYYGLFEVVSSYIM